MQRDRFIQRQLAAGRSMNNAFCRGGIERGQSTIELIAAQTFVIDTYITNIYICQWRAEGEGASGATAPGIQRVKFKKLNAVARWFCH